MKAIERYLIYIVLLGVIGLYIMQFTTKHTDEVVEAVVDTLATKPKEPKEGKIYYVNTDTVWEKYKYVQDAMKQLEQKQKQYENQLDTKLREFEQEVMEFRQSGAGLSEIQLKVRQQSLMEKENALGELKSNLETRIMEEEKSFNQKIRKKIIGYIEEQTKDLNYDYILSYSMVGSIVLANDSLDLTDMIVKGLNEQYAAEQNAENKSEK